MPLQLIQPSLGFAFLAVWVLIGGMVIRGDRNELSQRDGRQCW